MPARQSFLTTITVVSVLLGLYLLYVIRDVLILIFVSILLATAIGPVVQRLRLRIGLAQAVLTIYLGIGLALGALGYFILSLLVEQVTTLSRNLPSIIQALGAYAAVIEVAFVRQLLLDVLNELAAVANAQQPTDGVAEGVLSFTISLFAFGIAFAAALVITYYWIVERPAILRLFLSLFPTERRAKANDIWQEVEARLGGWVRGQLILMGLIAILYGAGLSAMGVKYALLLAVFAGVTELIPFVGPWIGSAPAVLVALTQSVWLAVAVVVFSIVVQTVEGNILVPRVLAGTIGISPLVVVVAIMIGVSTLGVAGALLAVPFASAIHVVMQALFLAPESVPKGAEPFVRGVERDEGCVF